MRKFSIERGLEKHLAKISRKDKALYEATMRKMREILTCKDVNHYKNLRAPMQAFKRIHILGPFVLVFRYLPQEDKVVFEDFDHHDHIYL